MHAKKRKVIHQAALSISSKTFARWQQASRSLSWMVHLGRPFGGRGRRGSAMVPFEKLMVVSIVTITLLNIRPRFEIECLRRSKSRDSGSLWGATFRDEWVDRWKPNLTRSGRGMGRSYAKKSCRYLQPFEHNART